jgi:C_GCAxxG_C_C family probable redox protein
MKALVANRARELFISGFNCAESVFQAIVENYGNGDAEALTKIATPFGGGVGGTKQELCGALTGGVMAFGFLYGRHTATGDADASKQMAARLRDKMITSMQTTQCQARVDQFNPDTRREQCADLVAQTAGWAVELLEEGGTS